MLQMKKNIFLLFLVCFVFYAPCNDVQASEKKLENLSFMGDYPDSNPVTTDVFLPFIKEVEAKFTNEISIDYFATGVLYPDTESYKAFNENKVDIGLIRPPLFPEEIHLFTLLDIPGVAPNAIVGSLAIYDFMNEFKEIGAELPENAKLLTAWASAAYQLHSVDPIKTVNEIRGKSVLVWDTVSFAVAYKLGAKPIRVVPTDTLPMLAEGRAVGVFCPIAPLRSFNLTDITKHHLMLNMGVSSFTLSIAKPKWNAFTSEMQKHFLDAAPKLAFAVGKTLEDSSMADIVRMRAEGHYFYELDKTNKQLLELKLVSFKEEWLQRMRRLGYANAPEIMDYLLDRVAYYQAEFDKGTYGNYDL